MLNEYQNLLKKIFPVKCIQNENKFQTITEIIC